MTFKQWWQNLADRLRATALDTVALYQSVRARVIAHTEEVKASQVRFQEQLGEIRDEVGISNVDRLLRGKAPVLELDAWEDLRRKQAEAAANPPPVKPVYKPWKGSAREAQMQFNAACEAYVAKHGIVALEEALKPEPTPVPVSDPEPPKRPPGKHYRQ